jgi:hypothetical protein
MLFSWFYQMLCTDACKLQSTCAVRLAESAAVTYSVSKRACEATWCRLPQNDGTRHSAGVLLVQIRSKGHHSGQKSLCSASDRSKECSVRAEEPEAIAVIAARQTLPTPSADARCFTVRSALLRQARLRTAPRPATPPMSFDALRA